MKIFVRIDNSSIIFDVDPSERIEAIKDLIYKEVLINPKYQRLTYYDNSGNLNDVKTLSDYNIQKFPILYSFNFLKDLLGIRGIYIPKQIKCSPLTKEYITIMAVLFLISKILKNDQNFFDKETINKILKLLELYFEVYESIRLPHFVMDLFDELNDSLDVMYDELDKHYFHRYRKNEKYDGKKSLIKRQ